MCLIADSFSSTISPFIIASSPLSAVSSPLIASGFLFAMSPFIVASGSLSAVSPLSIAVGLLSALSPSIGTGGTFLFVGLPPLSLPITPTPILRKRLFDRTFIRRRPLALIQ